MSADELTRFYRQQKLQQRLREHGIAAIYGVTTLEERRQHARAAIIQHDLAEVLCGHDAQRKPVTYRQAFLSAYGEPLESRAAEPVQTSAAAPAPIPSGPIRPDPIKPNENLQGKLL